MGLLDRFKFNRTPAVEPANNEDIFKIAQFSKPELPFIKESRNADWVSFGADNLYPQQLIHYQQQSAIHNAIIQSKTKMQAGLDLLFNGGNKDAYKQTLDPKQQYNFEQMYSNPSGTGYTLQELNTRLSFDWQTFGAMAIEVIWSLDFTRIAEFRHIDVSKIRSGKLCEDLTVSEYYYSSDWSNKQIKPIKIAAFDKNNKKDYNQLIYVRSYSPGIDYYGVPAYNSAIPWIMVDIKMGEFHLSNIQNGFSPSMAIKFYKKPGSPEERDEIAKSVVKQFSGSRNAGKAMVFFSDGKDLAPDVEKIEAAGLDQMFLVLGEQVVQQIISAHRVTSPMLLGIATPGKLGYSQELVSAHTIFDKEVVQPDQSVLTRVLTKIFETNGFNNLVLTIDPLIKQEDLQQTKG